MPRATVVQTTKDYDLKTVDGGKVTVRRMTYGEKLSRQDDLMSMSTTRADGEVSLNMNTMFKKGALTDFANLVVSHNLTDENDRPLNFKDAKDVLALDPRVGDEIGSYIDEINSFGEDLKN